MITDARVQALAREAAAAHSPICESCDPSAWCPLRAATARLEKAIADALTTALEEDRATLETAIRCLPSFAAHHGDVPLSEYGDVQVRLEAVCALVRGRAR